MNEPIVVNRQTIGVGLYYATAEQGETVKVALVNYGFLLKSNDCQVRRVSFAAFADCIEANCDLSTPQAAEVVRTLRDVHQLQAHYAAAQ